MPTVLLVEDEAGIRELLRLQFERAGFQVLEAPDGRAALQQVAEVLPDVAIVDWMLPDLSGPAIVERWRREARTQALPVVMLTAKASEEDKIQGLERGADDYVTKPFSPRELIARVRAVLRRRLPERLEEPIEWGEIRLDPMTRQVRFAGRTVTLGPTEARLLQFFLAHPERVWDRAALLDRVWGDHVFIEERTVDVHVRRLRLALEPIGASAYVQTVRGLGYRFAAPEVSASPA